VIGSFKNSEFLVTRIASDQLIKIADMQSSVQSTLLHSEDLAQALEAFVNSPEKVGNQQLQQIIENISKTGITSYSWSHLKVLISFQISQIFVFHFKDDPEKPNLEPQLQSLTRALYSFSNPPFTLQRICELILNPVYKTAKKYLFAVEKLLLILTTQPQLSPTDYNFALTALLIQKKEVESRTFDFKLLQKSSSDDMDTTFQNGKPEERVTPMEVDH